MERQSHESFEDYKVRRKETQAERRISLRGNWKKVKVMVDGEQKVIPAIHHGPNRKARRMNPGRLISNKKGIQLVVTGRDKYKKVIQEVDGKTIVHNVLVPNRHSR